MNDIELDHEQTFNIMMEEIYREVFDSMDSICNVSIIEDIIDDHTHFDDEEEVNTDYDIDNDNRYDEILWVPDE